MSREKSTRASSVRRAAPDSADDVAGQNVGIAVAFLQREQETVRGQLPQQLVLVRHPGTGDKYAVEGAEVGSSQARRPPAQNQVDQFQLVETALGPARDGGIDLHSDDPGCQLRHQCRQIARTGAHLQHIMVRLDVRVPEDIKHRLGRRDAAPEDQVRILHLDELAPAGGCVWRH